VDGTEAVELDAVFLEEIANLYDILVEGTTADIGVDAPDGVDQRLAWDYDPAMFRKVGEDTQFLAP
jgi:hypothetical protein